MSRSDRRAALLDAAAESLRTADGSLTFDGVADLAGVSPTLPYKYFGSVDELATELYHQIVDPIDAATDALLADPGLGLDDTVRATMHLWCDVLRDHGILLLRLSDDVAHPSLRHATERRRSHRRGSAPGPTAERGSGRASPPGGRF